MLCISLLYFFLVVFLKGLSVFLKGKSSTFIPLFIAQSLSDFSFIQKSNDAYLLQ